MSYLHFSNIELSEMLGPESSQILCKNLFCRNKGKKMSIKGKLSKRGNVALRPRPFASAIVIFVLILNSGITYAQTSIKRYAPVGGSFIPFFVDVAPLAPTSFTANLVLPNGVQLNWSLTTDTTGYRLEHKAPNSTQWLVAYNGNQTSFSLSGLEAGQNLFRVLSCGGSLCSSPTATRSVVAGEPDDTDFDGVYDFEDDCAGSLESETVDARGCSLSQLDSDADGVNDALDQCPGSTQSSDSQGCDATQVDTDNDGINDAYDQCSNTSGNPNGAGCSSSQLDTDNDGVNDAVDQCPESSSDLVGQTGCAVPATDSDSDGIPDYFDNTATQCVDVGAFDASNQ